MRVKNTDPGPRGFGVDGVPYEIGAGATAEIPDAVVKKARQEKSVDRMFVDGPFVIEAGQPAPKADDEAEPVKADKGKGTK